MTLLGLADDCSAWKTMLSTYFSPRERAERRGGDEGLLVVAAAVARVLGLLLQHADDQERRPLEQHGLADGVATSLSPKMFSASLSPRKITRRCSRSSIGIDEAPARLRDEIAHRRRTPAPRRRCRSTSSSSRSRAHRASSVLAGDRLEAAGFARGPRSMSSSVTRIRRPLPSPSNGIDVRPGQAMTMRSPRPAAVLDHLLVQPLCRTPASD